MTRNATLAAMIADTRLRADLEQARRNRDRAEVRSDKQGMGKWQREANRLAHQILKGAWDA